VVLANGLAQGGPAAAREGLARFWRRSSNAAGFGGPRFARRLRRSSFPHASFRPTSSIRSTSIRCATFLCRRSISSGFAGVLPVRLLIAATRLDGRPRLFGAHAITLEAVLASATLPLLHHAVAIDGEWYWDGGYSANPPLRQLVVEWDAADIMLVQITPEQQDGVPRLPSQIARLVDQFTFTGPLRRDIEALDDLCALCRKEKIFRSRLCRKLNRLRRHHSVAEHTVPGLHRASALNIDWGFLTKLKQGGREAAADWLAGDRPKSRPRWSA
jgi:NTE family protein